MIINEFFKKFESIFAIIEDGSWNLILSSMFPEHEQPCGTQLSAITIGDGRETDRSQPGARSITADITSDDPLERILAYSISVLTTSLLLKTSKQRLKGVRRKKLRMYIATINGGLSTLVDWYDDCITSDSYNEDYKNSVREVYKNCSSSILNFNEFVDKVNKGTSNVEWIQPDDPSKPIPELKPLPIR
jgi:hypothetical protein